VHTPGPHRVAAAGAVVLTVLATFLALATRVEKLETGAVADDEPADAGTGDAGVDAVAKD